VTELTLPDQVRAFAEAASLEKLPEVVDVRSAAPLNPPEQTQMKFVGRSYEEAYTEAASFVTVVDEFAAKYGRSGLAGLERIVDFGSGWGRITRTLLTKADPTKVYALDVDSEMTALVNMTLPGVNALTISSEPPTVFGGGSVDGAVAFSVFSHLSGPAHEAWAAEIGRMVRPGGFVAITVLDESFFDAVSNAQAAVRDGGGKGFSQNLAVTFPDLESARQGYDSGEIQYAASGGGGVRTDDYYGWAVAPAAYIERAWSRAGFRVVEWVPTGVVLSQALVFMVRSKTTPAPELPDHLLSARLRFALRRGLGTGRRIGTSLGQARGRLRRSNGN
jgi:SAM-dependent methyltransferase